MERRWTTPEDVLARAVEVVGVPLLQALERTSLVLHGLVPHTAAAQLSDVCAYAPKAAVGERALVDRITAAELGRLAVSVRVGTPWQGEAVIGGATRTVLGVASAPPGSGSALLALTDVGDAPIERPALAAVQGIWDLVTVHAYQLRADAYPERTAVSRAAAAARASALAELADIQSAALAGILGTLRSTALDDASARRAATELAVDALAGLRAMPYWNRELSEESADEAFHRLARELRPLFRHGPVRLGLQPPGTSRSLPSDVAHAARAVVRGTALGLLEQDGLGRMHAGWWLDGDREGGALRVTVRDDGPGRLDTAEVVPRHLAERVGTLGGAVVVEAVPGWGTTVTVTLPLVQPEPSAPDQALDGLHPRELEVLEQLALGRRNREIAATLHISQSTVKFHVANILGKLGVSSRGEAAALARHTAAR